MKWTVYLQADLKVEAIAEVDAPDMLAAMDAARKQFGVVHAPRCLGVVPAGSALPSADERQRRINPDLRSINKLGKKMPPQFFTLKSAGLD